MSKLKFQKRFHYMKGVNHEDSVPVCVNIYVNGKHVCHMSCENYACLHSAAEGFIDGYLAFSDVFWPNWEQLEEQHIADYEEYDFGY